MYRKCECLKCGQRWDWKIVRSASTPNLSGEKTIRCPQCHGKNVMAGRPFIEDEQRRRFHILATLKA
jgi:DNA-directed RNA polymerase subunit RPC12/RpoP